MAAKKLQFRCVMETHVITIKPPLQIVDIGNGCEAYSASIYIPAKSVLMEPYSQYQDPNSFLNITLTILMWVTFWYGISQILLN